MKAVVLAAGKSTRSHPLTLTRPKPVLPLLGRPLLGHTLEALAPAVAEAIVVVNYRAGMVRETFGEAYRELKLTYVTQAEPRGTADAVAAAREIVGGDFLIVNGDDYYGPENVAVVASCPGAAILVSRVPEAGRFGVVAAEGGRLRGLREKPDDVGAALVNTGLYKVDGKIFEYIDRLAPSARGEMEFTAALAAYGGGRVVSVLEATSPWLPIATARDLLAAQLELWPCEEATFLAGGECRLSPEAAVGGRSVLGRGCEVGARAVVEASLLLDGVTVGEGAAVTGSLLGEGAIVGPEAVVDGAVLGDGARVGASARLAPGSRVWPGGEVEAGSTVTGDVTSE